MGSSPICPQEPDLLALAMGEPIAGAVAAHVEAHRRWSAQPVGPVGPGAGRRQPPAERG